MRRSLLALAVILVLPASTEAAPPWSASRDEAAHPIGWRSDDREAGSPAHATTSEPPWFSTVAVSPPHRLFDSATIAAARGGDALATWSWQDETRLRVAGARRPRNGAFGPERALPAGTIGGPVLSEPRRAVVATIRPVGSNRDPRSRLSVALGSVDGTFGPQRLVARHPRIARPALAGNERGDLALAWFEDRGTRNDRVMVSLRRHGRSFGAPVRLATGRLRNVTVAVGARGHVLVAWEARGVVRARFKRPGARGFGRVQTIRSNPAFFTDLHAVVAPSGRSYVAWSAQFRSEGGDVGDSFVELATRSPGARFGRARLLESFGPDTPQQPVDLAPDGRGGALLGWTGAPGRPRLAVADANGFLSVIDLPATGALADVATAPGGRRLVLWTRADTGGTRLEAAYDGGPGGFGPPEPVALGDLSHPQGAISERSNPVAVYIAGDQVQVASRRG
jgi:hypothetical protein